MAVEQLRHSDFSVEQITDIDKNIRVVNNTEKFWGQFVQNDRSPNADLMKYRHQVLKDPTSIATLVEAGTPRKEDIEYVQFDYSLSSVGSYIPYTREALKKNLDSLMDACLNQLSHSRLYDLETLKFNAFKGTTTTFTFDTSWKKTLKLVREMLVKNHSKKKANGHFYLIAPVEITDAIADEAGDELKGTTEGAKVLIEGFIGSWKGFDIYERSTDEMYVAADKATPATADTCYIFAFGLNEFREFPVKARSIVGDAPLVITHSIGDGGHDDPLDQYGSVGSRIDGVGAAITNDECVAKCNYVIGTGRVASAYAPESGEGTPVVNKSALN